MEIIHIISVLGLIFLFSRKGINSSASFNDIDSTLSWFAFARNSANEFSIPIEIVLAMIDRESAGNPNIPGSSGELGLMQMKPDALTDTINILGLPHIQFEELRSKPEKGIRRGTAYLSIMLDKMNGNMFEALRAYNAGYSRALGNKNISTEYANDVILKSKSIKQKLGM